MWRKKWSREHKDITDHSYLQNSYCPDKIIPQSFLRDKWVDVRERDK